MPDTAVATAATLAANSSDGARRQRGPPGTQDGTRPDQGTRTSGGPGPEVSGRAEGASRPRRPRASKPKEGRAASASGPSRGRLGERKGNRRRPGAAGDPPSAGGAHRPQHPRKPRPPQDGPPSNEVCTPAHTVTKLDSSSAPDASAAQKRPRRNRARKFGSELTGGGAATDSTQDVSSADKYKNTGLKPDDLTSRLIEELSTSPYPDCLICFAPITPMQQTWSCSPSNPTLAATDDESGVPAQVQRADANAQCCWMTFHLKCIRSWASKSVKDVEEAWRMRGETRQGDWRCPGCQSKRTAIPSSYWCFCGSTPDPKPPRLSTPHSCANPCSRPRGCGHPPAVVATAELSCGELCGRMLSCGNHTCQDVCHPGKCSPCPIREKARCYCGKEEKELGCGEGEPKACHDQWVGRFACEKTCERPFDCGIHHCKKSCHPPSVTSPPCPNSPSLVTHCPCGKHPLVPDSAPFFPPGTLLTRSTCMKPLEGCEHVCSAKCHTGPCPPCSIMLIRCSEDQARARARARGETGPDTEILCERPCGALRACGRHQCTRLCCPMASLAGLAKGKGKRRAGAEVALMDQAGVHECDLVCGKPLSCGNHYCEERDHRGACPPCLRSSFEEMVCHCGRTVLDPPIPCGTRIACGYPCSRPPPPCGHPKTQHACHEDPIRCPPCPFLTSKQCACGKKMVDNVRCSQEKVSCGTTCGKLLSCGFHHCERLCHGDACGACHATCGKPRKLCLPALHPCTLPCHAPASCDESEPCRSIVTITCSCGRIRQPVSCGRSSSNPAGREGGQQLKCSNECAIAKRNARLAEALGINPDRDRVQQVTYNDELLAFARANTKFCGIVEKSFSDFLSSDKKSQILPHMPEQKRKFVHDLAAIYRMDTQMVDQEPHRTRPPQPTSPAPSSWGSAPERAKTPVRPAPSPAPVRTIAMPAPAPLPVTQPLSPQDVPDDWEDAA
ncbi:hypothetical protein C8T65DRAFT_776732 [Cerioporus squamosus]|nr:hypothetical protein C8T65DRAFT_776732 [Cerioporus squamosus]